jgi:hypothetical protein
MSLAARTPSCQAWFHCTLYVSPPHPARFVLFVPLKGGLLGDVTDTPQFWGSFDQCSWVWVVFRRSWVGIYGLSYTHARHFPPTTNSHHHTTSPPPHHHTTITQTNYPTTPHPSPQPLTLTLTQIKLTPLQTTPTPQWQTNGPQKGSSPVYSCTLPSS